MDPHPSLLLLLSEQYVKLPPTLSSEEQGEDQCWHSAQSPITAFGERGQPVSLAKVKLILSPVQETNREGSSQLLSELTKPWTWHCWLLPPSSEASWADGGHRCVWGMSSCLKVPAWSEDEGGLVPLDISPLWLLPTERRSQASAPACANRRLPAAGCWNI